MKKQCMATYFNVALMRQFLATLAGENVAKIKGVQFSLLNVRRNMSWYCYGHCLWYFLFLKY
jgi:hypothetical protein